MKYHIHQSSDYYADQLEYQNEFVEKSHLLRRSSEQMHNLKISDILEVALLWD